MNAKTAREQRRETKRTLGHKLEEFAQEERRRLEYLEERLQCFATHTDLLEERNVRARADEDLSKTIGDVQGVQNRGLFGRLKWLLGGA